MTPKGGNTAEVDEALHRWRRFGQVLSRSQWTEILHRFVLDRFYYFEKYFLEGFVSPQFWILLLFFYYFWSGSCFGYSMEVCYQLPVLPLDRPVPKHVLSRRGAISFSSSSSLFGAPDPRQLSQVHNFISYALTRRWVLNVHLFCECRINL